MKHLNIKFSIFLKIYDSPIASYNREIQIFKKATTILNVDSILLHDYAADYIGRT